MARPLAGSVVVILCALLLERILRLIDLVTAHGATLGPVLQMALNLIPHYLGLALPAAFFVSMFVVVSRLADDAELDAMMAAGHSLRRLEMPFVAIALLLTFASIVTYGFLQPYTRYAYRAIFNLVKEAGWTGHMPQGVFVNAGNGMTIFADAVDPTGRRMLRMFIHERKGAVEVITTAERGELQPQPERGLLSLKLHNGRQVHTRGAAAAVLDFEDYAFTRDFSQQARLFRPRGADEREMTIPELYEAIRTSDSSALPDSFRAEFHGRLARAASILFLPFFAIPMGLAAKRGRRTPGLVIAALILVLYHHALQIGEGLVDLGRADPIVSIWGPFTAFAAFCIAVTIRTDLKSGGGPLDHVVIRLEALGVGLTQLVPMRWRAP